MSPMDRSQLFTRVKKLQLISNKLVESLIAGNYRSVFKGPGIEFDEVRDYVEGDEARLIDWNVSSRLGSTFTKTFREERELTLFLIVDLSLSLKSGSGTTNKKDTAALLFSMLTFAAIRNNDRVGATFFSDRIESWVPPLKGKKHALSLIQNMLEHTATGKGSDLGMALRSSGEALKRRGICIILSDFKTAGYLKPLSVLSRKHDVIAIKIYDPVDYDYPKSGLVRLEDPESGRTILASGNNSRFREQYRDYWMLQNRQWKRECKRRGIGTLEVSTAEDPAARLIHFFRRRRGR
jgi:uncharacterized protein (DUF58 family)